MMPSAVLVPGGGLDISLYSSGAEFPPYEIVWSKTSAAEAGSHFTQTKTNAIQLTYFTFFVESPCFVSEMHLCNCSLLSVVKERQEHYHNWRTTNRPQPQLFDSCLLDDISNKL